MVIGATNLEVQNYKLKRQARETTASLKCPDCGSEIIISCPGGTCWKPDKWAKKNIKYICIHCLCEFGDPDSEAPALVNKEGE